MPTSLTQETNIDQSIESRILESFKFSLTFLVEQMAFTDDLILRHESVTETIQADHTANIKAKDNHRSDKKSNNSHTSVISEKKNIVILGDSTIKHVNAYEMSKKFENCKIYLKIFSGSKVRCMKDHMKLSMREKPDHTILHVGTNVLNSDRPSNLIAKSIVDLDITLKNNSQNVSISNIIMRKDNFNEKAMEVNGSLKQFYTENNIFLINQTKQSIQETLIEVSYISTNQVVSFSAMILLRQYQVFWIDIQLTLDNSNTRKLEHLITSYKFVGPLNLITLFRLKKISITRILENSNISLGRTNLSVP